MSWLDTIDVSQNSTLHDKVRGLGRVNPFRIKITCVNHLDDQLVHL
jgi:hypothetical protein